MPVRTRFAPHAMAGRTLVIDEVALLCKEPCYMIASTLPPTRSNVSTDTYASSVRLPWCEEQSVCAGLLRKEPQRSEFTPATQARLAYGVTAKSAKGRKGRKGHFVPAETAETSKCAQCTLNCAKKVPQAPSAFFALLRALGGYAIGQTAAQQPNFETERKTSDLHVPTSPHQHVATSPATRSIRSVCASE